MFKQWKTSAVVQHLKCAKTCSQKQKTCNHTCSKKCYDDDDCGLCILFLWSKYLLSVTSTSWSYNATYSNILPFFTATKIFLCTLAKRLRSDVRTLDATRNAMRPVHHAFKTAHGHVSIKAVAPCLTQHLATAFHAHNAVPKILLAAISAQVSAARSVH